MKPCSAIAATTASTGRVRALITRTIRPGSSRRTARWYVVWRGYGRLSGLAATATLERLYESGRLYVNFFQPSFKLASKQHNGAVVHKRYHPPLTPHQRLLASNTVDGAIKKRLRAQFAALDPVVLLKTIRQMQRELLAHSNGTDNVPLSPAQPEYFDAFATAWHSSNRPPQSGRKKMTAVRWWRTRSDPFAESWSLVESWLMAEPNISAQELMARLTTQLPDLYPTRAQLRTLQRWVKAWRAQWARQLVFAASSIRPADHELAVITTDTIPDR